MLPPCLCFPGSGRAQLPGQWRMRLYAVKTEAYSQHKLKQVDGSGGQWWSEKLSFDVNIYGMSCIIGETMLFILNEWN